MKHDSKLTLSDEELQLVTDTRWILTKHVIIRKVSDLFGSLAATYRSLAEQEKLPSEVFQSSAKISKGENYRQLPYVMLDYPRCFNAENTFAIRTMFWWGNFFSATLQLGGEYKKMFEQNLIAHRELLVQEDFYICINEDRWQHHFENDNYSAVNKFSPEKFSEAVLHKEFLKLAVMFPLQSWNEMPELLERSFITMLRSLRV